MGTRFCCAAFSSSSTSCSKSFLLTAFTYASAALIFPSFASRMRSVSISCMPCSREVEITEGSWNAFPLRIRLETASLLTISSTASTRPGPLFSFIKYWQITARSESARVERTCCCCPGGKALTMRSTVVAAETVCTVPNTRWPVSAATTVNSMVGRSRISPTRMTFGSSRKVDRSAAAKLRVCVPTSRWLTRLCLRLWITSMGSSSEMMCREEARLM